MKTSVCSPRCLLPLLLAGGLVALGCGNDSGKGTKGASTMDASSIGLPGGDSGLLDGGGTSLTDSQIAGVIAAVNAAEIDQGKLASTKAEQKAIVDYAKLMVAMHTQAESEQTALLPSLGLTEAASALSVMLSGNGSIELKKLSAQPAGLDFDFDYITAQASQHQLVLDLIDQTLLVQASSPALETALQTTRAMVKSHLDTANTLVGTYTLGPDGGVINVLSDAGV